MTRNISRRTPVSNAIGDIPETPPAVNMRLRSLPTEQQTYIAGKYYGGKMPWKDGEGT